MVKISAQRVSLTTHLKDKIVGLDACVIIRAATEETGHAVCASCLNKIPYVYKGCVSHAILGEVLRRICDFEDIPFRDSVLDFVSLLLTKGGISLIRPAQDRDAHVPSMLSNFAGRVDVDDVLHLSNMKSAGVAFFITTDEKMLAPAARSIAKNKFGIQILSPDDVA